MLWREILSLSSVKSNYIFVLRTQVILEYYASISEVIINLLQITPLPVNEEVIYRGSTFSSNTHTYIAAKYVFISVYMYKHTRKHT